MEQKLAEERAAKLRLENRILELEKHSSMMDCDYKQALQKQDELRIHKDRLSEEVIYAVLCPVVSFRALTLLTFPPLLLFLLLILQVKNLTLKIEQETQKRYLVHNDLKAQNQQLSSLRASEKQLKQEINHLLDIKSSLEKQNQELRR